MLKIKSYGESGKSPCPLEKHTENISATICFKITGIEVQGSMPNHTGHQVTGGAGQGECGDLVHHSAYFSLGLKSFRINKEDKKDGRKLEIPENLVLST